MSKTKTLAKSYVKKKAYGVILSVLGSIGCGGLLLIMLFAIIIISSFFAFNNYQEEVEKNSSSSSNGDTKCIGGNMSKNSLAEFEKNAKGGALEGKTKQMQKIAKQEKIPEILFFSIVAHESGWGKDSNSKVEKNPFSIMGTGPLVKYDTIEEGLKDGARNLYDLYIAEGLTTPEKIGPKYAPIGADNDQTNVNSNWVTSVKTIMKQFKGSNVSCEKSNTKGSNAKGSNFKGEIPEWDNNPEKLNLYTPGQCTWYVYAIRKKMNKPVSTYYHDAWKWDGAAKKEGMKVGTDPKVGAVMIAQRGAGGHDSYYGHVAIVTKTDDNGGFDITEMNYKGPFVVSDRHLKNTEGYSFIY